MDPKVSGRGELTNSYKTCVLTRFVLKEGEESNSASASTDNRDLSKYSFERRTAQPENN